MNEQRLPAPPAPSSTAPFDEPTLARLALARPGLDFEVAFFERARRRDPLAAPVLEALGHAYTQSGRVEEGLAVDLVLRELRPRDPIVRYNLACSHALLGDKESGLEELERAVALGYDDLEHLEADRDLDALRDEPRFLAVVKKLGGDRRAAR